MSSAKVMLLCTVLAGMAATATAAVPDYPSRPIRFIVPFGAGGPGDALARMVGKKLTESLGQPVVIDNRPGATTIIGTELAAQSPPDGYTLLLISTTHAVNQTLFPKLPYDPLNDFSPITLVAATPFVLVVHPSVAAKTVPELVALAKSRPGPLTYGSSGNGSSIHLTTELLNMAAKVQMIHVPYKGSGPAFIDLIAGQINMLFSSTVSSLPHVKNGKVRALALTSAKRAAALPQIPAVAEYYPGFESSSWFGMLTPAKTPTAVIDRLHRATQTALASPDVHQTLVGQGADPGGSSPQDFAAYFKAEIRKWGEVVRGSGVRLEQ